MNAVMICLSKFVVITDLHVEYPDRCGSFDSGSEREGRGRGGGWHYYLWKILLTYTKIVKSSSYHLSCFTILLSHGKGQFKDIENKISPLGERRLGGWVSLIVPLGQLTL